MKTSSLLLILLAGCGGSSIANPDGGVPLVTPSDAPEYVPGVDAAKQISRAAARVACQRLYSDCKSQCDSPFALCGTTVDSCVDNYVGHELAVTPEPWSSAHLGNVCAAQLATEDCTVLGQSVECGAAVEQGCANDTGVGAYSYLVAPDIGPLPASITVHHCGEPVLKWVKVELPVGVQLKVVCTSYQGTGLTIDFGRLRADARTPDIFDSIWLNPKFNKVTKTITVAGTYYLRIYLDGADAPADLKLELSSVQP